MGRHTGVPRTHEAGKGQLPSYGSTGSLGGTGPGPDLSTGPDQRHDHVLAVSRPCPGRVSVVSWSCPCHVQDRGPQAPFRPQHTSAKHGQVGERGLDRDRTGQWHSTWDLRWHIPTAAECSAVREYACHFGVDCSEQAVIRFEWSLAHHGSWTRGGPSVTSRSIYIKRTLRLNQTTSLAQRPTGRASPAQSGVTAENCEAAHASTATRSWSVGWGQQHSRRYSFAFQFKKGINK